MQKRKMWYLATPYSHPDPKVREERYWMAVEVAGFFIKNDVYVYSPIAHTHPIAEQNDLPTGWEFWKAYDTMMMSRMEALIFVRASGWEESRGMMAELNMALELMPVVEIPYPRYEEWWANGGRDIMTRVIQWLDQEGRGPYERDGRVGGTDQGDLSA